MIISFILAKHIRYNTNKLNTSNTCNDNKEPVFYIDFEYDIQQEFLLETPAQWESVVSTIIFDLETVNETYL